MLCVCVCVVKYLSWVCGAEESLNHDCKVGVKLGDAVYSFLHRLESDLRKHNTSLLRIYLRVYHRFCFVSCVFTNGDVFEFCSASLASFPTSVCMCVSLISSSVTVFAAPRTQVGKNGSVVGGSRNRRKPAETGLQEPRSIMLV